MISNLKQDLPMLIESSGEPSISIYLPTHRVGDIQENMIRFKNLLGEARKRLMETDIRKPDADSLLDPAERLLSGHLDFWQHQNDGLAIFVSPGLFKYYRLPISFEALVAISKHFHLKPLLQFISSDYLFHVLALGQKSVRLLRCSREGCHDVSPESLPTSIAEALRYDDPERQLQFHTGTGSYQGKRAAMFHGHGVGKDDAKTDILRFSRQVARSVENRLKDEQSPLVLAAVDYLHPIYWELNAYPHLLHEGVQGNPEGLSEKEILVRSWPIVESYFNHKKHEAIRQYYELRHTELASKNLQEILVAAYEGRVYMVFIASGVQKWGFFDYEKHEVTLVQTPVPGSRDLLDLAGMWTWSKRGGVYFLEADEMPNGEFLMATLRY